MRVESRIAVVVPWHRHRLRSGKDVRLEWYTDWPHWIWSYFRFPADGKKTEQNATMVSNDTLTLDALNDVVNQEDIGATDAHGKVGYFET